MKGYGQFCPIAVACETLTQRWTPLVLRELMYGSRRFNDLRRGLPLMSPSLLANRLRTLERAGIVERLADEKARTVEYRLTAAGEELRPVVEAISAWGLRWSKGVLDAQNLDASLLMWDIRRGIRTDRLSAQRVVVHFHLRGSSDKRSRFWLVLDAQTADLCLTDPGFDVDLQVSCHVRALVRYWLGLATIDELVRTHEVHVNGLPSLVRAFPSWFQPLSLISDDRVPAPPPRHLRAEPPGPADRLVRQANDADFERHSRDRATDLSRVVDRR